MAYEIKIGLEVRHPRVSNAIGTIIDLLEGRVMIRWKFTDSSSVTYIYDIHLLKNFIITPPMSLEEQVADLLG